MPSKSDGTSDLISREKNVSSNFELWTYFISLKIKYVLSH